MRAILRSVAYKDKKQGRQRARQLYRERGDEAKIRRRRNARVYVNRRYRDDPEFKRKHLANVTRNNARYKEESLALIRSWKAQGCSLCDETEPCCLCAHHVDPKTKKFCIGGAISRRRTAKSVAAELRKCACLCANCHAKVHAGIILLTP